MMIAILIAAIVVALVVFSLLCYKKAPPTQAIVVTGFGLSRPKVVCGRGVFVLPVVQRADRLRLPLAGQRRHRASLQRELHRLGRGSP